MFEDQKNLYSLSSGYHAPEDVKKDLTKRKKRTKLQEEFVNDRIKTMTESFYYPIKKNKLKTFSTNTSKTGKALVAERDILNRVLVACEFAQGHQSQ